MNRFNAPAPMNPGDDALIQAAMAYLDGELTEEQARVFEHRLIANAAERRLVAQIAFDRELLAEALRPAGAAQLPEAGAEDVEEEEEDGSEILLELIEQAIADRRASELRAEREAEAAAERERRMRLHPVKEEAAGPRVVVIPRWVVGMAAAAAVLLFAWLISGPYDQPPASKAPLASDAGAPPPDQTNAPRTVGVVIHQADARWSGGTTTIEGEALHDRPYELAMGVVELRLNNGVRLTLEAPARIDLSRTDQVVLSSGRLCGEVPIRARGFTVRSPDATVVDLGTEFAVDVLPGSGTHIQVYTGRVTVAPAVSSGSAEPALVLPGQAREVRGGRVLHAAFSADAYLRRAPSAYEQYVRTLDPMGWWSFNEIADGVIRDRSGSRSDLSARGDTPLIDALQGRAIPIDGAVAPLSAGTSPAARLSLNFTIEAWIRVESIGQSSTRVVSSRDDEGPGGGFGFGLAGEDYATNYDCIDADGLMFRCGPLSPKLTYFGLFDLIAEQPIPAGQWTQIVAVGSIGRPARLYINGEPVRAGVCVLNTQDMGPRFWLDAVPTTASRSPLVIGRNPGPEPTEPFVGEIDELAIYGKALTDDTVRELYRRGVASAPPVGL